MSLNEGRAIHATDNWSVVLQSVPSKHRKEVVKHLEEVFELEKSDAEDVLGNMPLILLDGLSFGLAVRVKKFFQKLGAVAETTNHDMIKKNCFQIVWPQAPDLSYFQKDESKTAETPAPQKTEEPPSAPKPEPEPSPSESQEPLPPPVLEQEPLPPVQEPEPAPEPEPYHVPIEETLPAEPEPLSQPTMPQEESPAMYTPAGIDSDWERRAKELNDKLRRIQDEKKQLHMQHAEVAEKVKEELQERIAQEKRKSEEIARAYEDLQKAADKHEALSREGEEWRAKAISLGEKVRELETSLMQRSTAIEHLVQEKDKLAASSSQVEQLSSRIADLEKTIARNSEEKIALQGRATDLERAITSSHRELESQRAREQELLAKTGELERTLQELTASLRVRDEALAQFEKQILTLGEQAREYDSLRQQHAQLAQEATSIRQHYETKLVEQEVRFGKIEEDNRRQRSRSDRKNAAATRELGEWIRTLDTVRQGLQKLVVFLGSESAVLDTEKKSPTGRPPAGEPSREARKKI